MKRRVAKASSSGVCIIDSERRASQASRASLSVSRRPCRLTIRVTSTGFPSHLRPLSESPRRLVGVAPVRCSAPRGRFPGGAVSDAPRRRPCRCAVRRSDTGGAAPMSPITEPPRRRRRRGGDAHGLPAAPRAPLLFRASLLFRARLLFRAPLLFRASRLFRARLLFRAPLLFRARRVVPGTRPRDGCPGGRRRPGRGILMSHRPWPQTRDIICLTESQTRDIVSQ